MKRSIYNELVVWREKKQKKPLILKGARQVGKTWLMKELGQNAFTDFVYINFEETKTLHSVFELDNNVQRILQAIQVYSGKKIDPRNTLLIFDEVQACSSALTSLKYFNENAPDYHIIAAGSLLGVALHEGQSFPVGKVEYLEVLPMSFHEFLYAIDQAPLGDIIEKKDWVMMQSFKQTLVEKLKEYYFVGGMPKVVLTFKETNSYSEARKEQNLILFAYENDFSKHAPVKVVPKIRLVWQSIIAQLSKENKKFIYKILKEGARAKEFEYAILWLSDAGLIHKVTRIDAPKLPLSAYEDIQDFKVFLLDIGLLTAMANIHETVLLDSSQLMTEFKGTLTEQYVLQQLKCLGVPIHYWTVEKSKAEVDFIVQVQNDIVPIEVKAAENVKSKSLRIYFEKYHPSKVVRTSLSDYRVQDWMTNIPLYAISTIV